MKRLVCLLALIFPLTLSAQIFQEDFSDGNYNVNPTWLGDTSLYTINTNNELQLNDTVGNTTQIYVPLATADSTVWEFYVRLEFAPSGSNRLKVFLMSDNNDFSGNLNGYFLQIGESGNNDAIEIYKQTGSTATLVFRGTDATVATASTEAHLKIIRNNNGNWQVFTDYSNGTNLTLEGSFTDNTHSMSSYFGFQNKYTSTRKDKFYFDNITISPLFQDIIPPSLDTVLAIALDTLEVKFNESLDGSSIQSNDFTVLGLGNATSAILDMNDPSTVQVILSVPLLDATTYTLEVANIMDVNGNNLIQATKDFIFYDIQMPAVGEVLINEIMADPSPPIGLPEAEFVELYNNSNKSFHLSDLIFLNSGNAFNLPENLLLAGQYVVLCNENNVSELSAIGNVIGINGFSGLTNSGDDLKIENINGDLIHEVNYEIDWYRDEAKENGGYTLELKNPTLICKGAENWTGSFATNGGTPNAQNSAFDNTPDTQPPLVESVTTYSNQTLLVIFTEIIDSNSAQQPSNYQSNQSIGSPDSIQIADDYTVKLFFSNTFLTETNYELTIENVADCSGNVITPTNVDFVYYEFQPVAPFDILITEIYADPSPSFGLPAAEYIELYNRSEQPINLKDFTFENRSTSTVLPDYVLLPNEYVALHEANILLDFSLFTKRLSLENLPALGNGEDNLKLSSREGELIYFINYTSDWYRNSIYAEGGRSLEMISLNSFCENANNWTASTATFGGTPGAQNSAYQDISDVNPPIAERAFPTSETEIDLYFNEKLSIDEAENIGNYVISNNITVIDAIVNEDYQTVRLMLGSSLEVNQIYTITIQTNIKDCLGNSNLDIQTISVGLPSSIAPLDVIINEVLFNPEVGGSDFLELYNRSDKVVNLKDIKIVNAQNGQLQTLVEMEEDVLFFPNTYIVISENPTDVRSRYLDFLLEMPSTLGVFIKNKLPSFPDDEGGIVLLNSSSQRIDELNYHEDWHHPLIVNQDGVSLERIDIQGSSSNKSNWQSAASTINYATPAYQNSQYLDNSNASSDEISLTKKTFSPDGDGFEDVLLINYNFAVTDVVANISIFDAAGRPIRQLTQNQLLGTSGSLKWDGTTDDKTLARMGIYILYIELIQPNGQVKRQKLTCVLAGKL